MLAVAVDDEPISPRFAVERFEQAVAAAGLSFAEVSRRSGVGEAVISKWRAGKTTLPSRENLAAISAVLNMRPEELLEDGSLSDIRPRRGRGYGHERDLIEADVRIINVPSRAVRIGASFPGVASQLRFQILDSGEFRVMPASLLGDAANPYLVRVLVAVPALRIEAGTDVVIDPERQPADGDLVLVEAGARLAFVVWTSEQGAPATVYDGVEVLTLPWGRLVVRGVVLTGSRSWIGRPS